MIIITLERTTLANDGDNDDNDSDDDRKKMILMKNKIL